MTDGMDVQRARFLQTTLFLLALFILLLWHSAQFYPFISDDALITLQYVKRFLAGDGLTWTTGLRVEGYSNLLWTLVLSMAGGVGLDLLVAVRLLGLAATLSLIAVVLMFPRTESLASFLVVTVTVAFLPLNASAAVWAIGGLELPLTTVLLISVLLLISRDIDDGTARKRSTIIACIFLGLISINRPDGYLFTVAISVALLLIRHYHWKVGPARQRLMLVGVPLLFVAAQIIFRQCYYGEWLPNTAYAKLALSGHRWESGWDYLWGSFNVQRHFWVLVGSAVVILAAAKEQRARLVLFTVPMVIWLLYVVAIGGDYSPAYRLLLPAAALGVLLMAHAAQLLIEKMRPPYREYIAASIIAVIALIIFPRYYMRQHAVNDVQRAISERWEWDGKTLAEILKTAFHEREPLMAVTTAGCLPYWSDLPAIDMFGLNDWHIARAKPKDFGRGAIGHELGDARYLLNRKPDMIILNVGARMVNYPPYSDTMKTPEFELLYLPVRLQNSMQAHKSFIVWMRRESARIGIRKWTDSLRIPGYYLQMDLKSIMNDDIKFDPAAPAYLDKRNVLVQPIMPGQRLGYDLPISELASARITVHGKSAEHVECFIDDGLLTLECSRGEAAIESVMLHWFPEKTDTH
jgi:hypothetical protein